MNKINVVIIDDEGVEILQNIITKFFENLRIVGTAENVKDGIECLNKTKPDLLFLDIKLPDGTGLDILERCDNVDFQVIFTTAYEEFALQAIERSALHYLLKPISIPKLREAIERYNNFQSKNQINLQIENLKNDLEQQSRKIILNSAEELIIITLDDILYIKSNGNYTQFYIQDSRMVMVSKTISHFESILPEETFFRVHKQYIVNMKHITSFQKGRGGYAIMSNDKSIEVSARRKQEFIEHLEKYIRNS